MSSPEQSRKKFSLLGTQLPIRAREEEELTEEAFRRVKEGVEALKKQSESASNLQIALLTALNLAGELIRREEESPPGNLSPETFDRIKKLKGEIDQLKGANNDNTPSL